MIPNVFHFVFGLRERPEPLHLMHWLCLESCLAVNAPDEVVVHVGHEPTGRWWERIRPRVTVRRVERDPRLAQFEYADPVVARYRYAHLADVARLQILASEGGIYADLDTLFVAPIPRSVLEAPAVMGRERASPDGDGESLCNAWIASEPGGAFVSRWLDLTHSAFDGSWSAHSTVLPQRLAESMPDAVRIEAEGRFFALDWSPAGIRALFLEDVDLPAGACSLHLWNHLWWDRARTDFSKFHAGRLSLAYVAHAKTTYARLARPHLPPELTQPAWRWHAERLWMPVSDLGARARTKAAGSLRRRAAA